jgi:quercetin dioxygenase-like cupin family protein
MRRILLAGVLLGLVVTLSLLTMPSVPAAQEATPTGEAAPVTFETLGSMESRDVPGKTLVLLRVTLAPGAVVPSHVHPGQLVVAVESGMAGYTTLQGAALVGAAGTPTAVELSTPGQEVLLGPGEWFLEEPSVKHIVRNAGDEPLVLLVSALVTTNAPFLQLMEADTATPVP